MYMPVHVNIYTLYIYMCFRYAHIYVNIHIIYYILLCFCMCIVHAYVNTCTYELYMFICTSIYVPSGSLAAKLCPTLCDPRDCSPPGSSVHGILQARVLEVVAFSFSRRSSQPSNRTQVSCIAGRFFTDRATREALYMYVDPHIHTEHTVLRWM